MKKNILVMLVLLFIPLGSFGQKILQDRMYGDSIRFLMTSFIAFRNFTDRMVLTISLSKTMFKSGDSFYMIHPAISTMGQSYIPENGRILFKIYNDSIFELQSVNSNNSQEVHFGSGINYTYYNRIGNTIISSSGIIPGISVNTVIGSYIINEINLV